LPNFGTEINTGNISENWLFILNNDNSGAVHLSFKDEMYNSNFYHGVILNKPSIRESVDLANSTSKSGNISINIPDFSYQGSPISEELFGGSNHYINQVVSVHSTVNGQTPIQIGSFRLIDISSDGTKLSISMTSHRPWDFISIPQTKTSDKNIYFPISYGDFTPNATARDYRAVKTLRPMPVNEFRGTQLYSLIGLEDVTSNAYPHYYDKSFDRFIPVSEDGSYNFDTNADSYQGGFAVQAHYELEKRITFKPVETTSSTGWESPDYAFDDADANEEINPASADFTQTLTGQTSKTIKFQMPQIEGKVTAVSMEIRYYTNEITVLTSGTGTATYTLTNKTWGANDIFYTNSATSTGSDNSGGSGTTDASGSLLTQFDAQGGWGDEIEIEARVNITAGPHPMSGQFQPKIYDVRILATTEVDWDEATNKARQTASKIVSDIETLYTGGDGLANSWDASPITKINEAHRDLLIRYAGLSRDTPENWVNLDADKDWSIRWWALEEVELKEVLEQLQYEGGFIFRYKGDGTPQYIHIRDTNTTDYTLSKYDVADLTIKPTSFSELLTKMDVSYEKHPAENRYLTTTTAYADTARTNWNIQAKENVSQVSLDAYVAPAITEYDNSTDVASSSPNDDFFAYYYNIFGDIKTIVSGKIVNPKYYNLEVGDIVEFSNIYPEKIFAESWSGKQYMITSLQRTLGVLTFESREI